MEVFSKISASRIQTNEKSVLIGDLYFNKEKIFTKKDVEEVVEFVKEEFPEVMSGNTFYINSFPHLFNGSITNSKKFMFVLSCLRDEDGESLFNLGYEAGLRCISIVTPLVIEAGKDKIKTENKVEKDDSDHKGTDGDEGNGNTDPDKEDVKSKELADTIADKFNLKELRNICKTIDGVQNKDVKNLKQEPLVDMIMENKTKEEIQKILGL